MNKFLPLVLGLLMTIGLKAQTDLFFSEYVEGSGNNKAVEIYNPTKASIDLSKYYVARFSNGSTTYSSGGITQLTGTLEPYQAFVLVNGQTTSTETSPAPDPVMQALADQLDNPYPAPTFMNGNDVIALMKSETGSEADALPVDLFGQIGLGAKISAEKGWAPFTDTIITYTIANIEYKHTITDYIIKAFDDSKTAAYGPYWLAWTMDHTLRRKYEVYEGIKENPSQFNVSIEWDTVSVQASGVDEVTGEAYTFRSYRDIWDDLGKHECIVTSPDFQNSVPTIRSADIQMFPTLINGQPFTIKSSTGLISTVYIYNLKGDLVLQPKFNSTNNVSIDLSTLSRGLYLVKTTTENNQQRSIRIAVQ